MNAVIHDTHWRHIPVRLDVEQWATRRTRRRILAVLHTVVSAQRLLDALRLLEGDVRVQVFFTAAPDVFSHGVGTLMEQLGGLVLPWHQAVQTPFDLALAASHGSLHELHAPVVVLPHGAGHNKLTPVGRRGRQAGPRGAYGLTRQRLVRDGVVIPEAIVLAHQEEVTRLGQECPEALPVTEVVGDPCYDRLAASLPSRALYREALGAKPRHRLVVACSTWGPDSLLGRDWELLERLATELPRDEYRVAALLHPHVWNAHGEWQVRGWLAGLMRSGLTLLSQYGDWVGALAAADYVVGDHGSVSLYGAMTGVPVLMADVPEPQVDPGSPLAELLSFAPRLHADRPLVPQLKRSAARYSAGRHERVAARITSEPGQYAAKMRALLYRKLRLRAPARRLEAEPARLPLTIRHGEPGSMS
ncbi:hypothetical protein [Streptomyces sp. HPF1205]|uniref:hypothetical protein n=1 Tax=Streptomyces sp. HPF1205 TaxID=2873262 RepID=UPI001CED3AFA|nr:hypothetical protein [Streptomyces sp. HPF1205]